MLMVRGRAAAVGKGASGVQIMAIGGQASPLRGKTSAGGVAGGIMNGALADTLESGEALPTLAVTVPVLEEGAAARESVLARRSRGEVLAGLQVKVQQVARGTTGPAAFAAGFDLAGSQRSPRNLWVGLEELSEAVGQPGQANGLLAMGVKPGVDLGGALQRAMRLGDYGLVLKKSEDGSYEQLMARGTYLLPGVQNAAETAAAEIGAKGQRVVVNLVSSLTSVPTGKSVYYFTGAGVSALDDGTELGAGDVAVNAVTAEQLGLKVGDAVTMRFYRRGKNGDVVEADSGDTPLKVAKILDMKGLGVDRALVPEFKGVTDVEHVADWRPPEGVKVDRKLADEAYWDKYRAAPRVVMGFGLAQKLWGQAAFEEQTGYRIPAAKAREFEAKLLARLRPADVGMAFVPVRERQLAAAGGGTDFAGLFLGFSFFLMAGAVVVMGMLFRLGVEQRVRQLGVMAAIGFTPGQIRMLMLREGMLVGAVGGLLGLALALAYTWLMVTGLSTWWVGATGTPALTVHVGIESIIGGYVAVLVLVALTVTWAVRRVLKVPVPGMMMGRVDVPKVRRRRGLGWPSVAVAAGLLAVAMTILGQWGKVDENIAFLVAGTMLLVAGLAALRAAVGAGRKGTVHGVIGLARRNAGHRPARSMLTASLIALASFTLVTVASMRETGVKDPGAWPSGTGGYRLMISSDIPLLGDLNTETGRKVLGVREVKDPLWERAKFVNMRVWRGEDVSCLNMTRPTVPTIVAWPAEVPSRFPLAGQKLQTSSSGNVPVVVDAEVAEYILHVPLGETLAIRDQMGVERKLLVSGLLQPSIFQSDVLMSPEDFARLFPMQAGYSRVLVECNAADAAPLAKMLEEELGDFSVTVERSEDRLAQYQAVANTYLSTFQALGSLGLLLGTVGVGVVLVRSVLERRAELALMGALGFRRTRIMAVVFLENAGVLAVGLLIGTAAAVLAVLPAARGMNWPSLGATFGLILAFGMLVVLAATRVAVAGVRARALRAE